jgi:hypothetical protein
MDAKAAVSTIQSSSANNIDTSSFIPSLLLALLISPA